MLELHSNINDVYGGRLAGQAKAEPYLKIFRFRVLMIRSSGIGCTNIP